VSASAVQQLLYVICGALVAACVGFPYLLGVRPRTPRQRAYITAAATFITWLLAGFVFLR
jgi:hypothetical protein